MSAKKVHNLNKNSNLMDEFEHRISSYGDLFTLVPCIISIQDRNYRILRHNNEFSERFGSKTGDYCFSAYKGRREKCADCPLEKTFNDGMIHTSRESGYDKDKSVKHWIVRSAPIRNKSGEVIAAMEMSIDITGQIETEQQLVQAGKMTTLGRMVSGIAHELNQPLTVIKTSSSFLIKKSRKKEKLREDILVTMLTKIDDNVDRASKIVNRLREFSRKSDMSLEYVQVNEVLEKALEMFNRQLKARGIQLIREFEEPLPLIKADPNRLEQVFINLIINARDAVEEKWKNENATAEDKKILLKTLREGKDVVVIVSDTGVGVSKEISDKIFEPFFTTKEAGKGTGLGLSISYGIIKECGGDIHVVSGTNIGATFIIELPGKEQSR